MKKIRIILTLSVSCFVLSCTKEKTLPVITTNPKQLHPAKAKLEDPSIVEKVGYYKPGNNILQRSLPNSVDLSDKMPDIGDQGSQGSCAGWAFGYYYKTYQEVMEKGWDKNNNAYSPSWIYNQVNGGVDEGASGSGTCNLLVDEGCDFIDNFPYDPADYTTQPQNASSTNALHYKPQSWIFLEKNKATFKSLLASSQPLVILFPIYPDFDDLDVSNPIYDDWSGTSRGNHFVCIVGYDDSKQAFKFLNSWGTDWGLNGSGWIAYSKIPDVFYAYLLTDKNNTYDTDYVAGDFNGDGAQDVLTANGYGLYVSWKGVSGLKRMHLSSYATSNLKTGDFNGDGKTDLFTVNGSDWYVSHSGTDSWRKINSLTASITELHLGDFNGDGKTDVFTIHGSDWLVSYSGTDSWTNINSLSISLSSLGLGDFNGDGETDIFYPLLNNWYVSYSGTGSWTMINSFLTAIYTMSSLKLGDFNGDGKTDVFRVNGSDWYVSYSGTGSWTLINSISTTTISNLGLIDLNGDHKCDVFYPTESQWKISLGGTSSWNIL